MIEPWADLGPDERLLAETIHDFAREVIAPGAGERDEAERFDRSLVTAMGELGLLTGPLPERFGGAGLSGVAWTVAVEEIAAADMALAVTLCVHVLHQVPLVRWGTEAQLARWLPALRTGAALGAFSLTEPSAGSDAAAIRTKATPLDGSGEVLAPGSGGVAAYRLDGTKSWVSNAPDADRYLVFATVDASAGARGITAFVVSKDTPGFSFGRHERKMGIRACPTSELVFGGCVVPVDDRLGGEGEGYRVALSALGDGRIGIAAACTGLARAALEQAAAYLKERRAFGAPVADLQALRFMVAEMAREVATARALTRSAAAAKDRGENTSVPASLAKWAASDAAMRVTTDAVQLFGAAGYSRETGVERLMRDAKGAQIYEGSNQVHRGIVADHVLGRPGRRGRGGE